MDREASREKERELGVFRLSLSTGFLNVNVEEMKRTGRFFFFNNLTCLIFLLTILTAHKTYTIRCVLLHAPINYFNLIIFEKFTYNIINDLLYGKSTLILRFYHV